MVQHTERCGSHGAEHFDHLPAAEHDHSGDHHKHHGPGGGHPAKNRRAGRLDPGSPGWQRNIAKLRKQCLYQFGSLAEGLGHHRSAAHGAGHDGRRGDGGDLGGYGVQKPDPGPDHLHLRAAGPQAVHPPRQGAGILRVQAGMGPKGAQGVLLHRQDLRGLLWRKDPGQCHHRPDLLRVLHDHDGGGWLPERGAHQRHHRRDQCDPLLRALHRGGALGAADFHIQPPELPDFPDLRRDPPAV